MKKLQSQILEKLKYYNDGDGKHFYAGWNRSMSINDPQAYFDSLYRDSMKPKFGNFVKMIELRSKRAGRGGLELIYKVQMTTGPAGLVCDFGFEEGTYRLVSFDFVKL
jgi:hypothetical protein